MTKPSYDQRKRAVDDLARDIKRDADRKGRNTSTDDAARIARRIADNADKKQGWGR